MNLVTRSGKLRFSFDRASWLCRGAPTSSKSRRDQYEDPRHALSGMLQERSDRAAYDLILNPIANKSLFARIFVATFIRENHVYCLKRHANIRSSTNDDKIHFGTERLRLSPNEPFCLVDLAIAHRDKGEFERARNFFEQALEQPPKGEGYDREYILLQYGSFLEKLGLSQKARQVFSEACRLGMKPACEKLRS